MNLRNSHVGCVESSKTHRFGSRQSVRPRRLDAPYRPRLEPLEDRTLMSTCHVTRLSDSGVGKGFRGDLRYCINKVNAEPGPDVIDFTVTGTITLNSELPHLASEIDIIGPGAELLAVSRNAGDFRIFSVRAGESVAIVGLTIANGGVAEDSGGGIWNGGSLHLASVHLLANFAGYGGGGIYNDDGAQLAIFNSILSHNHGSFVGGGIKNNGTLVMANSAVIDNHSGNCWIDCYGGLGAGINNDGLATITNSTISGNFFFLNTEYREDVGGGVWNRGTLHLAHSTVTNNEAWKGGGIFDSGSLFVRDSIIGGNTVRESFGDDGVGPDVYGVLDTSGYNLIGDTANGSGFAPTDLLNVDPMLGPLQDNGGDTFTHALLPSSPAIDAGDNTDAPDFDQRGPGFPRIVNGTIDIGAFEVQATGISNPPSAGRGSLNPAVLLTAAFDASDDDLD